MAAQQHAPAGVMALGGGDLDAKQKGRVALSAAPSESLQGAASEAQPPRSELSVVIGDTSTDSPAAEPRGLPLQDFYREEGVTPKPRMQRLLSQQLVLVRRCQAVFRSFLERQKLRRAVLWKAWNELDEREEKELQESYKAYEEEMRRSAEESSVVAAASGDSMVRSHDELLKLLSSPVAASEVCRLSTELRADDLPPLPQQITMEYVRALIRAFRNRKLMSLQDVLRLLERAYTMFEPLPNVVEVKLGPKHPITIVGDIHGQLDDLVRVLELSGFPAARHSYLFNGDFVDRGERSVECIVLMLVLKVMYPGSVYLNRGNHEARDVNHRDGFERELLEKYGSPTLFDRFCALFCSLPLVHIVNSDLIVIHGGIMERPMTVAELNSVNRFHECPSRVPVVAELLWSDPTELHDLQIGKSKRGAGIYFGRAVFERFMATLGCSRLIRSHQCKQDGYEFAFDRRCLTLFSASNYCGKVGNYGAYAVYEKDNPLQITPYYVGEDPKRKRVTVRALNLQEAVVRKLSTRIGSNRLRLIQFFSSVEDKATSTVNHAQFVEGLRTVLGLDLPFMHFAVLLGVPKVGKIDYLSFLSRYAEQEQRFVEPVLARQRSSLATPEEKFRVASEELEEFAHRNNADALQVFRFFDKDASGKITLEELKRGFASLNDSFEHRWEPGEIEFFLQHLDADKNGEISFAELAMGLRLRVRSGAEVVGLPRQLSAPQVTRFRAPSATGEEAKGEGSAAARSVPPPADPAERRASSPSLPSAEAKEGDALALPRPVLERVRSVEEEVTVNPMVTPAERGRADLTLPDAQPRPGS